MKTKDLVRIIREIIRTEVQKQVSEQVTRILQEQSVITSIQKKSRSTPLVGKSNFNVQLDEPLIKETTSPLLGMLSSFEHDEFGGNMHFDSKNMSSINGILNVTAQQMKLEAEGGEGEDTSAYMKDYSKVLKASYDKSNGIR